MKTPSRICCTAALAAVLILGAGCAQGQREQQSFLSALPATMTIESPQTPPADDVVPTTTAEAAPGVKKMSGPEAVIDYSNTDDGYVMVEYTGASDKPVCAIVHSPSSEKTYTIAPGQWTALPLDEGDGLYEVGLYKQTDGETYDLIMSQALNVELTR